MTFSNIFVKHIYCEANCCVNRLAKLGCTQTLYFVTFYNPLPILVPLLTSDKVSLYIYIYIYTHPKTSINLSNLLLFR